MTNTFLPLASTTFTGTGSSVVFSNLGTVASGMRDLIIRISGQTNTTTSTIYFRFNNTQANSYQWQEFFSTGTSLNSPWFNAMNEGRLGRLHTTPGSITFQIFDFAQTNKHKHWLTYFATPDADETGRLIGRWTNTAAITQVEVYTGQSFVAGTNITLYGVV